MRGSVGGEIADGVLNRGERQGERKNQERDPSEKSDPSEERSTARHMEGNSTGGTPVLTSKAKQPNATFNKSNLHLCGPLQMRFALPSRRLYRLCLRVKKRRNFNATFLSWGPHPPVTNSDPN